CARSGYYGSSYWHFDVW
nr:immunoglobulin heavy chain junction region [Mus musculus]